MSTVKTTYLQNASASSPNITLDANNNATFAGTVVTSSPMMFRNRIINGAMEIDQRNFGAAVTNINGYFVDRWASNYSGSGRMTAQQSSIAPSGFTNSASLIVTTSSTPGSTDYYNFFQGIEGLNVADLGWGTSAAKTVTISFWVRNSITGLYALRLCNDGATRSYVATYNVNAANTWEYKTITIPGDTSGTWAKDTASGIFVAFDMGHGTSFNTTSPNTWIAGNFTRTASCVNFISNSGATVYITGVQLELGTTATPFEKRPYGMELNLCQRYYETGFFAPQLYATTGNAVWITTHFSQRKRVAPTVSVNTTASAGILSSTNTGYLHPSSFSYTMVVSTTGYAWVTAGWAALAEF